MRSMDEIKQIYFDESDRQREWGSSIRYFDEFLRDSVNKKTITEEEYQQYFAENIFLPLNFFSGIMYP